jgi:glyoxylase-like metal-dependent hydrolase (beta-lactamase superfamily II)
MNLHVLPAGPIPTNAFLLTAPELGEAVLIDAPEGIWADVKPLLAEDRCVLKELWITHGHWDHTQGAAEVVRASGARVRAHPGDREMIESPKIMSTFLRGVELEPVKVDEWLKAGERLAALGTSAEVRHVPGHSPGNVLFFFRDANAVFVGDALFRGSVGRTDVPGGDFAILEKSIREQIYTLPPGTVSYSGHGPKTTVGEEMAGNPYVRAKR